MISHMCILLSSSLNYEFWYNYYSQLQCKIDNSYELMKITHKSVSSIYPIVCVHFHRIFLTDRLLFNIIQDISNSCIWETDCYPKLMFINDFSSIISNIHVHKCSKKAWYFQSNILRMFLFFIHSNQGFYIFCGSELWWYTFQHPGNNPAINQYPTWTTSVAISTIHVAKLSFPKQSSNISQFLRKGHYKATLKIPWPNSILKNID